jgi:predicted nucleic acid-binding protein
MIVLDTNVVSELMKPEPAEAVVSWMGGAPAASFYTTSITEAEILHGILLLPAGRRRRTIEATATAMFREDFSGRVLAFDEGSARPYAEIATERRRAGRPMSHFDAQIAAIARSRNAVLATRNVSDFEGCGIETVNPWQV